MTDAELNKAIYEAGRQVRYAVTEEVRDKALDHLETLREAQRRRAQRRGETCCESDGGRLQRAKEEISVLKDTIDCQDKDMNRLMALREQQRLSEDMRSDYIKNLEKQLEEAKGAAARADKVAEKRHADAQDFADLANDRLMKIRKLEQQVQTHKNTIARQADMIERMNVQIRELS